MATNTVHSSRNVTKTKTLNKVDESILVSFIRSLSQIIEWSHPQRSIRSSSFIRFSGSETAESSKPLPRALIEREKKNSVCNHYSNHKSTNHRTLLVCLKLFFFVLSLIKSKYWLILKSENHFEEQLSGATWKTSAMFPISEIVKTAR